MTSKKTVIIIAGPTAVGKTGVAIRLAQKLGTEIISADSRQCYKELRIGVARPSEEELRAVRHHFIASHSIHQKISAAGFEAYALEKTAQLFERYDTIVMVGGTGLYIRAFCEGLDEIPEVPEHIRQSIIKDYTNGGLAWLQQALQEADPKFLEQGEIQNPQRLMRALEVVKGTGRSILTFRKGQKARRSFDIVKVGLELPRELLIARINQRVEEMVDMGLVEEVRSLIPFRHLNALNTVGYKEIFDYFDGTVTLSDAVALIRKNTWQYARRQLTWFRKDPAYTWVQPVQSPDFIENLGRDLQL